MIYRTVYFYIYLSIIFENKFKLYNNISYLYITLFFLIKLLINIYLLSFGVQVNLINTVNPMILSFSYLTYSIHNYFCS